MDINIGFKYSVMSKNGIWRHYEVVGSRYGKDEGFSTYEWKEREDVLKLKKYVQVITLPGDGVYQLSIGWISLKGLQNEIREDMKLLPEYRKFKITE